MKSIAMFNNKGGIGKTTLTCNLSAYYSSCQKKYRVLVVDCDPQCNASQLIMGEDFATEFYWNSDYDPPITTIRDILRPIEDGDSDISKDVRPILSSKNRFNVDLIPGHPGFSIVEDRLGAAWHDLLGGDVGGIRKTNWNTEFCAHVENNYDLVFFDLGPSLGSINRSILIGCDYFITPMGADIFSILGVRNIANWISHWAELYENSIKLSEQRNPGRLSKYNINSKPSVLDGYLGYTMQQYITKSKQGVRRPTKAYEQIITSIPDIIFESLGDFFTSNISRESAKLGDIPHLYSLIPLAQSVASPILDLKSADGLVGAQFKQREDYQQIISTIATNIERNLEME